MTRDIPCTLAAAGGHSGEIRFFLGSFIMEAAGLPSDGGDHDPA